MLGVVIGPRKETKIRIEHESGAIIHMVLHADDSESENWTCTVTGGHEECLIAAKIIQDLIDNAEVCALLLLAYAIKTHSWSARQ